MIYHVNDIYIILNKKKERSKLNIEIILFQNSRRVSTLRLHQGKCYIGVIRGGLTTLIHTSYKRG